MPKPGPGQRAAACLGYRRSTQIAGSATYRAVCCRRPEAVIVQSAGNLVKEEDQTDLKNGVQNIRHCSGIEFNQLRLEALSVIQDLRNTWDKRNCLLSKRLVVLVK